MNGSLLLGWGHLPSEAKEVNLVMLISLAEFNEFSKLFLQLSVFDFFFNFSFSKMMTTFLNF